MNFFTSLRKIKHYEVLLGMIEEISPENIKDSFKDYIRTQGLTSKEKIYSTK